MVELDKASRMLDGGEAFEICVSIQIPHLIVKIIGVLVFCKFFDQLFHICLYSFVSVYQLSVEVVECGVFWLKCEKESTATQKGFIVAMKRRNMTNQNVQKLPFAARPLQKRTGDTILLGCVCLCLCHTFGLNTTDIITQKGSRNNSNGFYIHPICWLGFLYGYLEKNSLFAGRAALVSL